MGRRKSWRNELMTALRGLQTRRQADTVGWTPRPAELAEVQDVVANAHDVAGALERLLSLRDRTVLDSRGSAPPEAAVALHRLDAIDLAIAIVEGIRDAS
jgi:hypothetical protein